MKPYQTTLKRMGTQDNEKKSSIVSFEDVLAFFLQLLCATVYKSHTNALMGGTVNNIYVQHSLYTLSNSN